MSRPSSRALIGALLALCAITVSPAEAQFGRNKVQWERFDWRILKTGHFDFLFYPAESLAVHDAGRMGERWYARLSDLFRHSFDTKQISLYADHPDFQQTNVAGGGEISEGTGGITEGLRTRVVMPLAGIYAETDHVLGHELVHVFQYEVANAGPGGLSRLTAQPLWLVEGMAEYLSLGRVDPLTAMWLRDATLRNKLPTIKQLNTDRRYFPYRYGHALWSYVGSRWGDRAVIDVYRASLRYGWQNGMTRVLGLSLDSLSKDWIAATKRDYQPFLADRTHPRDVGRPVIRERKDDENLFIAPTVSPDGRQVAFFANKGLFDIELFVADAQTGARIRKLGGRESDPHFDAISFIATSGAWSPDASRFAYIVFAEGDHQIAILNTRTRDVERRIKLREMGAVTHLSWSPDGRTLALSGQSGGITDLWLLELDGERLRRLTDDRHADLHPAWSPDGRTIAFATDRGERTNFNTLTTSDLQLATIDVATGRVQVFSPFARGKHTNPQWTPDGRSLYFISDQDGYTDVYRLAVAEGAVSRVTRVATGISGYTRYAPALTVARQTGRVLFSVFDNQGFAIHGLDAAEAQGTPVATPTGTRVAAALPIIGATQSVVVDSYLADPATGLPGGAQFAIRPYRPRLGLDAVGQPSLGVSTGGPFGTGVQGGISFLFGDQLGDQQIGAAIQASGQARDIGGQVYYQNLRQRWNFGAGLGHIPLMTGYVNYGAPVTVSGGLTAQPVDLVIQRLLVDQASLSAQYPLSTTRRFEINANATRVGFSNTVIRTLYLPDGRQSEPEQFDTTAPPPLSFASGGLAYVGDNSFTAYTSPIRGGRYRFEVSPTFGAVQYQALTADWRRYLFLRPVTLAFRGLHFGRYGRDADEDQQLGYLFVGDERFIRGYAANTFGGAECAANAQRCPAFERLIGSRIGVANLELRIPLIGAGDLGLIDLPFLPVEVAPFVDAGVAWRRNESPRFTFEQTTDRAPVFSAGVTTRINLLGYAIGEIYAARPFQRPRKQGWVFGFQLVPGF